MPEVLRSLASWSSGQLAWILSSRGRGRKSAFELWSRGGAADRLPGAAPGWAWTPGPGGFFPAQARAPAQSGDLRCHLQVPPRPFLAGHLTHGRQGYQSDEQARWPRPGHTHGLTSSPGHPAPSSCLRLVHVQLTF